MGAPGWDDAPMAQLAAGDDKPITLIWPYYDNPRWLETQIGILETYSPDVLSRLRLIVSDDCSPTVPALDVLRRTRPPVPTRVFRILVDIRWNWLAARNVAMKHAEGWCLVTDIDHVVPEETLRWLMCTRHDFGTMYRLLRREHTGVQIHPHPNSFFVTTRTFWKTGGYDEALSGFYGTDGDFRRRAAAAVTVRTLPHFLVRHEHQGDSSTVRYKRKQPEDAGKKAALRKRGRGWKPRVLSFPYEEQRL